MLFVVVDNVDVAPWPLIPYQEGYVSLRCSYRDKEGWYSLTMPVNRWVAMVSGRMIGFPKYLAKEITLAPSASGWRGEVSHKGTTRSLLEFTHGDTEGHIAWKKGGWPMFNLRPPGKGPKIRRAVWSAGKPSENTVEQGMVRITFDPNEPWSDLVAPGTVAPGWYETFRGGAHLVVDG